MIDKAYELHLAQVNQSLRHILRHVYDRNLVVHWRNCLVRQNRIVDDPKLRQGLLGVVPLITVLFKRCCEKV